MTRDLSEAVAVRLTRDMHDALRARANENDRTLAQEVRHLIRQALDTDPTMPT